MRKIILILSLLLFITVLHSQSFYNGIFESWTGDNPDGWTLNSVGSRISFEKSTENAGRGGLGYALKIIANSNASGYDGQMEAMVTDIQAGQNYTLSIWTKQGPGDGNDIWVRFYDCRFYDGGDNQVGNDYDEGSYSSGDNTDWLEYTGDQLTAPANAVKLRVNFRIYVQTAFIAGDYILVDDLSINGQTLPVTLSTFTAQYLNNIPILYWVTQSETDNIGWYVYRNTENDFSNAEEISGLIDGYGTTSEPHSYIYEDPDFIGENVFPGDTYWYWLESIDYGGMINHYDKVAHIVIPENYDPGNENPEEFEEFGLFQSNPNPFNPKTKEATEISFNLKEQAYVEINIYNIKGELVKTIYNGFNTADEAVWDGKDENGNLQATGIYLYELKVNNKMYSTKKIILIK